MNEAAAGGGGVSLEEIVVAVLSDTWPPAAELVTALADEPGLVGIHISADRRTAPIYVARFRPSIALVHEEVVEELLPETGASQPATATRILVLASSDDAPVKELIERGCAGVLPPDASLGLALAAVKAVARGEIWAPRRVLAELLRSYLSLDHGTRLTKREDEILHLVVQGKKNNEIAEELFISRETVRWHLRRVYAKLGIRGRPTKGDVSVINSRSGR